MSMKSRFISENIFEKLKEMKPLIRRPIVAFLTEQIGSRNDMVQLMGMKGEEEVEGGKKEKWRGNISRSEWGQAISHRCKYGALVPAPKRKYRRQRFKRDDINVFLGVAIQRRLYEQTHAFGSKSHAFRSGAMVRSDAVSLTV